MVSNDNDFNNLQHDLTTFGKYCKYKNNSKNLTLTLKSVRSSVLHVNQDSYR